MKIKNLEALKERIEEYKKMFPNTYTTLEDIYNIVDIKMRMLKVSELKKIMGFPESYVLIGTQSEQKKFIGNAVEVNMSRVLCEALCQKLSRQNRIAV